ncbi:MAG: PD-(D/E)XK nuclease family protein, partial [Planctomycetales bacterium]|nr:PD-(D/E)XK nuclease family protein [Planctomycetales bacterium]
VQGVAEEIVFSFPRQGLDGVVREPSGVLLEVAAALRRPVGDRPAPVPSLSDLRRGYLLPAATAAPATLLTERGRAHAVASRAEAGSAAVPAAWLGAGRPALDLARLRSLALPAGPGAADGLLGASLSARPGLDPAAPLSASRIQTLLECPHRFLLAHVLGWEEPAAAPDTRRIGQPDYGSLVHRVLERFGDEHGERFTARADDLEAWRRRAEEIAGGELDEFLRRYPLLDGPVRAQERERVLRDVGQFLVNEWGRRPGLRYLAVERAFGYPDPVALDLGEGLVLHVHGFMDHLDRDGDGLLIRDYKTGRAHPRAGKEADPVPEVDVQLAVYGLAAEALRTSGRATWGPLAGLAYAYPEPRDEAERAWEGGDLGRLLEAARGWLRLAARLLAAGAFPRTPREDDCATCPFRPVCGPGAQAEAAERLAGSPPPVADFLALKAAREEVAGG